MNALADGPNLGFAGQRRQRLDRVIGHHIVKLAHQSLVRTEHDRANRAGDCFSLRFCNQGRRAFAEAYAQAQLHRAIVVTQCAHRSLVLSDAGGGCCLHRADDGLEIPGSGNLPAHARRGVAHAFSSGFGLGVTSAWTSGLDSASGFGWKRASDLRAISTIVLRSSSLNLSAVSNRPRTSAGISAAASHRSE